MLYYYLCYYSVIYFQTGYRIYNITQNTASYIWWCVLTNKHTTPKDEELYNVIPKKAKKSLWCLLQNVKFSVLLYAVKCKSSFDIYCVYIILLYTINMFVAFSFENWIIWYVLFGIKYKLVKNKLIPNFLSFFKRKFLSRESYNYFAVRKLHRYITINTFLIEIDFQFLMESIFFLSNSKKAPSEVWCWRF